MIQAQVNCQLSVLFARMGNDVQQRAHMGQLSDGVSTGTGTF
jgi:hypothetical protein